MPKTKYKKRADGRYIKWIYDGTYTAAGKPHRVPVYGRTIAELDAAVEEAKARLSSSGAYQGDRNISLLAYCRDFVRLYKAGAAHNTQVMYANLLRLVEESSIASTPVSRITKDHLMQHIAVIQGSGRMRTAEQLIMFYRQVFDQAEEAGLVSRSPMIRVRPPRRQKKITRTTTLEEEAVILSGSLPLRTQAYICLMLFCSMRMGEALAIESGDIDFTTGVIHITKAIEFLGRTGRVKPFPKSDAGNRDIPMIGIVRRTLAAYVEQNGSGPLFHTRAGAPATETVADLLWAPFIAAVGTDITTKVLRHTFSTYLLVIETNIKIVQQLMGHASAQMTLDVYTHLPLVHRYKNAPICEHFAELKRILA